MLKSANVILLFCSIFFVLDANAQKTSFGPHAGIMTVNMNADIDDFNASYGKIADGAMDFGYQSGFFFRQQASVFTIGAELNFQYFHGKYDVTLPQLDTNGLPQLDTNGVVMLIQDLESRYRFMNIQMPVLAGLKLGAVRLSAGPTLTYTLDVRRIIEGYVETTKVTDDFKSIYLGYQAGLGFDIGRFSLDFKYDATSNILAGADVNPNDVLNRGSRTRSSYIISVGFDIIGEKKKGNGANSVTPSTGD